MTMFSFGSEHCKLRPCLLIYVVAHKCRVFVVLHRTVSRNAARLFFSAGWNKLFYHIDDVIEYITYLTPGSNVIRWFSYTQFIVTWKIYS